MSDKPCVILDTNVWLRAIAQDHDEPDNNSKLDIQARTHGKGYEPYKVRGAIIALLTRNNLIVPEIVLHELERIQRRTELLSEVNRKSLSVVLDTLTGKTTPFLPRRIDIIRQNLAFGNIKTKAEAKKSPGVMATWEKIEPYYGKVRANLSKLEPAGEPTYTILKQEIMELETRAETEASTPAKAGEFLRAMREREEEAEKVKPYFLPDFEILLCAHRTQATIFSLDKDMLQLWANTSTVVKETPQPQPTIGESSRAQLLELKKALRKSLKEPEVEAPGLA